MPIISGRGLGHTGGTLDKVLGDCAGNAVEVEESLALLRGEPVDARFHQVTVALSRELLELGKLDPDEAEQAISSGAALERFETGTSRCEPGAPAGLAGSERIRR